MSFLSSLFSGVKSLIPRIGSSIGQAVRRVSDLGGKVRKVVDIASPIVKSVSDIGSNAPKVISGIRDIFNPPQPQPVPVEVQMNNQPVSGGARMGLYMKKNNCGCS